MKTAKIIVLSFCALSALAACNKNQNSMTGDEPWVYDESLPVPVQILGQSSALQTKAGAITPVNGTLPANVHFGVFGVGDPDKDTPVLFQDLAGKGCNALDATISYNSATGLYLADLSAGGRPVYYPIRTLNNYSFYGYHAGNGADNTVLSLNEDGEYTVAISDYGFTDVLWATPAVAEELNGLEGYNTKYVREIKKLGRIGNGFLPRLDFGHQTAAFEFYVKASDAAAEASFGRNRADIRVVKASVEGLKTDASLIVLSDDPERNGLIVEGTQDAEPHVINLGSGVYPTVAGAIIGDGVFVSPESLENVTFTFELKQASYQSSYQYTVTGAQAKAAFAEKYPDFKGFEKGNRYQMNILLNKAMEVEINVTLQAWEDKFADIITVE